LKPRDQRKLIATEIINRLRPQVAKFEGANLFLQATQDITVSGRSARASFQYTLQDPDIPELVEWSQKLLQKLRTLSQLVDVSPICWRMRVVTPRDFRPAPADETFKANSIKVRGHFNCTVNVPSTGYATLPRNARARTSPFSRTGNTRRRFP
jgi:hypothetical protein